MSSNRLQYLDRKNKKFFSRGSGYKGSRKEDQKGCFNCKKPGHFIADCPDLQKEKSKKPKFKSNKFRRQIKQSLKATWEDLDNELRSNKDEAEDEANVVVGLVATVASDAESRTDSELIESFEEFLTRFENRSNELKDLIEKYVSRMRQHEKILLDLKESEKENESYDFIIKNYEEKLKYLFLKLNDKCNGKPLSKQEIVLKDFIMIDIDRNKVASMIYGIYHNNGRGIGFTEGKPNELFFIVSFV